MSAPLMYQQQPPEPSTSIRAVDVEIVIPVYDEAAGKVFGR